MLFNVTLKFKLLKIKFKKNPFLGSHMGSGYHIG